MSGKIDSSYFLKNPTLSNHTFLNYLKTKTHLFFIFLYIWNFYILSLLTNQNVEKEHFYDYLRFWIILQESYFQPIVRRLDILSLEYLQPPLNPM